MSLFTSRSSLSTDELKNDLTSGFFVFLIALPLCLGIAMASGFPPIAGIMTAVVGGLISTFLGSSALTIKGPAAGLIVIAIGAVTELGGGDPMTGYKRALAVGVLAALIQIVFSLFRAATLGIAMSPSVVHGMLSAIGVIIIAKQAHTMVGVKPESKGVLDLLAEIPHSLANANPEIAAIGLLSLAILFGLPLIKKPWAKKVPAPIIVLLVTVPLGFLFDLDHSHTYSFSGHVYNLGPEYLVQLPGNVLNALTMPDFSMIASPVTWKYVMMFALVGSIESVLSVLAVDAMDPKKRASNLNKDLFAVGIGNLICGLIGGLPMISEIVRSKANIDAEARTAWSNFFHGLFLLLFVALIPGMLHRIPLAALAAMLVYTGFRLASPAEFKHVNALGKDQLFLFVVTLVTTLATDLLMGVGLGLVLKVLMHVSRGAKLKDLVKPEITTRTENNEMRIVVEDVGIFTTLLKVRKALEDRPPEIERVVLDVRRAVLVDHTFIRNLQTMAEEWETTELVFEGLERMKSASEHPLASRRKAS
jgi:MFS superfamily sulfate permease-like transporter